MWYSDEPWTMSTKGFQGNDQSEDSSVLDELNEIRSRAAEPIIKLQSALADADTVRAKLVHRVDDRIP